jgi:hypothetical protein
MPRRSPKKNKPDSISREPTHSALPDRSVSADLPREPEPPPWSELPAPGSIISETEFTSPTGAKYRIIKTTETDPYDKPKRPKRKK